MELKKLLLFAFIAYSAGACVSIEIPPGETRPADYRFTPPPSPFVESRNEGSIKSWLNKKNGNSISVLSNCTSQVDPSVETLQKETVLSLENPQLLSSAEMKFNQRNALISTVEGNLDGISVKIRFLILKKNNCHYNISYIGVKNSFDSDLTVFRRFLDDFEAP